MLAVMAREPRLKECFVRTVIDHDVEKECCGRRSSPFEGMHRFIMTQIQADLQQIAEAGCRSTYMYRSKKDLSSKA